MYADMLGSDSLCGGVGEILGDFRILQQVDDCSLCGEVAGEIVGDDPGSETYMHVPASTN
jgi:hypothetical protein